MTLNPSAAVEPAVKITDKLWALSKKPHGWLVILAAVLVLGWAAYDRATAATAWKGKVDDHLQHAVTVEAAAIQAFGKVEAKVDKLAEAQERDGARLERIEDALIRQRVRAADRAGKE
jgi:hypothetical protein